jgi:hypothetical protein
MVGPVCHVPGRPEPLRKERKNMSTYPYVGHILEQIFAEIAARREGDAPVSGNRLRPETLEQLRADMDAQAEIES